MKCTTTAFSAPYFNEDFPNGTSAYTLIHSKQCMVYDIASRLVQIMVGLYVCFEVYISAFHVFVFSPQVRGEPELLRSFRERRGSEVQLQYQLLFATS